jgi:hypothetical protein
MAKICAVGIVTYSLHRNVFQMIVNILRLPHTTMAHGKEIFFSTTWKMGRISTNTTTALTMLEKKLSNALSMGKLFCVLPKKLHIDKSELFLIVFVL